MRTPRLKQPCQRDVSSIAITAICEIESFMMKTYDKSGVAGAIILPEALQRLVDFTPDHELLLAEKLCFHLFVWPNELCWMDSSAFRLDASGEPIGLNVGRDLLNPRSRVIPIDPPHRAVLPDAAAPVRPAFPWPRSVRSVATVELEPSNKTFAVSRPALSHDLCPMCRPLGQRDHRQGLREASSPRGPIVKPGGASPAEEYFAVDFHLSRSALRPRYCGPDAVPRQLIRLAPKEAG